MSTSCSPGLARGGSPYREPRRRNGHERRVADHLLITALTASALPHLLKTIFDQERPDRRTVVGHWRGIPFSGKKCDAFPSGHAVHIGALASAASRLPASQRNLTWGLSAGLLLTRVVLLAHWLSDVVVGLAVGIFLERMLRRITGYGSEPEMPGVKAQVSDPAGSRIWEFFRRIR